MCLAVPMQITHLDGFDARCSARGVERDVSLFLLQGEPVNIGDYVLIHVGYAIQTLSAEQAQSTWELFDQILDEEPLLNA
ncbi:MAG: HypC/HybG/HupF family hydrogenase formation chaperone [Proteobacteria bacterium]|nr:HypC/HybG/HupF family hydrogenase formation chaperone [Pseudomonadota bacterium]